MLGIAPSCFGAVSGGITTRRLGDRSIGDAKLGAEALSL
jgi:hypothetical protein